MTSIVSSESIIRGMEYEAGYRRLPERLPRRNLIIGWMFVSFGFLFLGFTGLLIFGLIAYLSFKFVSKRNHTIAEHIRTPIGKRPFATPVRQLPENCLLVDFGGRKKVVIQIASPVPPDESNMRWLDSLPSFFNRKVQIVETSGIPKAHDPNAQIILHHLIMIDAWNDTECDGIAEMLSSIAKSHGIEPKSVDSSVFEIAVSHKWWFTHLFASNLRMAKPIQKWSARYRNTNHTLIVTLDRKEDVLSVSSDLFFFAPDGVGAANCEELTSESEFPINSNYALVRHEPLALSAAFVDKLIEYSHKFKCLPAPLTDQEREALTQLPRN